MIWQPTNSAYDKFSSRYVQDAINILVQCEAQTGSAARSKFLLARIMHQTGNLEEAGRLHKEVEAELLTCGYPVDVKQIDEQYVEQFVLVYHR